jgi:hypothetical protein
MLDLWLVLGIVIFFAVSTALIFGIARIKEQA